MDHVKQYRRPKDEPGHEIIEKGCAQKSPTPSPSPSPSPEPLMKRHRHRDKDRKKKKKKHKKQMKSPTPGESESGGECVPNSSGHPQRGNRYDSRSSGEEEERESYNQRQKKKGEREAEGKRARGYVGSSNRQPDSDGREQDPHAVIGYTKSKVGVGHL